MFRMYELFWPGCCRATLFQLVRGPISLFFTINISKSNKNKLVYGINISKNLIKNMFLLICAKLFTALFRLSARLFLECNESTAERPIERHRQTAERPRPRCRHVHGSESHDTDVSDRYNLFLTHYLYRVVCTRKTRVILDL